MTKLKKYQYIIKEPRVPSSAFIATGTKLIGAVVVGDYSSIWYNAVVRADINKIEINKILDNGEIVSIRNISEIKRHPLGLNWARKKDPDQRLFW